MSLYLENMLFVIPDAPLQPQKSLPLPEGNEFDEMAYLAQSLGFVEGNGMSCGSWESGNVLRGL